MVLPFRRHYHSTTCGPNVPVCTVNWYHSPIRTLIHVTMVSRYVGMLALRYRGISVHCTL